MGDIVRERFLAQLAQRYGRLSKLDGSQSLFDVGERLGRIYVRYSKLHKGHSTFYGLRRQDLRRLEGHPSFICFLWDGQEAPLLVPFTDYEDVFAETSPAGDGQYKSQVRIGEGGTELYIARAGSFNVDANIGWAGFDKLDRMTAREVPQLTHCQIQTMLGAIGTLKRFDIWIPAHDRETLDWSLTQRFRCLSRLPYDPAAQARLQEIDAAWLRPGSNELIAAYEIEHSTPIYSGLLRLNDIRLAGPAGSRLAIVSNDSRRSLFLRQ
ncbi:MAG TPA: hypothetical protein VGT02_05205, partial [Methylomirabilota bacterium]|nr:hypothetical protein [Methylomirabilota bacterium]